MDDQSPQLQDGYVRIANKILEALVCANLNGSEWCVVIHIIRKTYGWNKKTDTISLSQFVESTGVSMQGVCKALNKLVLNKIIVCDKMAYVNRYGLNKRHTQWILNKQPVNKMVLNKTIKTTKQNDKKVLNDCLDTKDTIQKTVIQKKLIKKKMPKVVYLEEALRLSNGLLKYILHNNSNFKHDVNTVPAWAEDIDKMIRIDGRMPIEIEQVIRFAQTDSFWKSNILSGAKLRKQFDQLWMKAKEDYQSNLIPNYE